VVRAARSLGVREGRKLMLDRVLKVSLAGLPAWIVCIALLTVSGPARAQDRENATARCTDSATGAAAIACANYQRAVNGIPRITEDVRKDASSWCPDEDDEKKGVADWRDMSRAVSAWGMSSSPWDSAPLHQEDIYNPLLSQAGDVTIDGEACWGTLPTISIYRITSVHYYTFISERGNSQVPASETTNESPFTPQQLVGLGGKTTGPTIIAYATGFKGELLEASGAMTATAWTLKTHGKRVQGVKMVDDAIAAKHGYSGYVDGDSVFIIPAHPLHPGGFIGTITWKSPRGQTGTQHYRFKVVSL
jgi:hypothetical protein